MVIFGGSFLHFGGKIAQSPPPPPVYIFSPAPHSDTPMEFTVSLDVYLMSEERHIYIPQLQWAVDDHTQ